MGSKARIAKEIIPIMLRNRKKDQYFFDVCCGGGNLIDKVPATGINIAADNNLYVVEALRLIQSNPTSLPKNNKEFTLEHYNAIRSGSMEVSIGYKGYVGYALSYGGKWFGGWCRDGAGKRDYIREAYDNAQEQSKRLNNVRIIHEDLYTNWYPDNSIIYVDPPYKGTTGYGSTFDHDKLWNWVREMTEKDYKVYVSEYEAPPDFKCVWEKRLASSLTADTGSKTALERLFIYEKR